MKHLLYRDVLGTNPRNHEVSIEEMIDRDRDVITKKKICKYFIRQTYKSDKIEDLRRWIRQKQMGNKKKDFHILKELNEETGQNKVVCKAKGDFYVVNRKTAYEITYLNEVRIEKTRKDEE